MPLTGTEALLASELHDAIKTKLEGATGYTILEDAWLQAFCEAVANALIPHLVTNTQVNTGQLVNVPGLGLIDSINGAVTGDATGTVDTTGTIS